MLGQMVKIGEETGELEKMLSKVADFYEDEVDTSIQSLTSIIEPILMIFVGAMVGVDRDLDVSPDVQDADAHQVVALTKGLSAAAAFGVIVVVALGTSAIAASGSATQARSLQVAVVASVYDGDTLSLRDGRRVRLLQIDTPELGSGECYSRAARSSLVSLAPPGSRVVLESDPALDRVDRYGRILRYVKRNGVNVNLELARRGAAAPYFYRGDRGRYAGPLMRAAQSAKASKRGLWKACPSTVLNPFRAVETGRSGPTTRTPPTPPPPLLLPPPRRAVIATRTTPAAASRRLRPISIAPTFARWASPRSGRSGLTRTASTATATESAASKHR